MANWLLDHATSPAELRAMWANVAACLRPGGRFLGIRATRAALTSDRFHTGHYGVLIEHVHEPSEHGARYRVSLVSDPRVSFEATPQPDLYDMVDEVPRALGFTGFASVPLAGLPVLDEDPAFWKEMLEEPVFAIVTATKA
ncbi:hypothetical protein CDD83_122 [Cordyceps sp. RAO-2017]|nr:hypothetical protein CDD83_122 [Cordyceps sp. RAO-2017]